MPFKSAAIAIDPYGDLTNSGITGVLSDRGNFDRRDQNVIQYWSPKFGGLAFRLAATANEGKTDTLNPHDYGANITWNSGPIYLFYAYEQHKDASATVQKEEGHALGGNVKLGAFKLGAQYQTFEKTNAKDQDAWMGNVVWSIGNNEIIYQYMQAKDGGPSSSSNQPDCKSNSIGYQYNFSKRTFFIASYVKVDNNSAATCNFGANKITAAAGADPQSVFAGIRHVF
jgi:predicted porin